MCYNNSLEAAMMKYLICCILFSVPVFAQEPEQRNVQILKGMDNLQLQTTMNFIRASLGVHCDFCHVVENDKWDFPSDDKDTKQRAREMIRMVIDVNKATFDGRPAVTCFTCHQGKIRPTGTPPLPQPAPEFPTVVPQPDKDLPAPEKIIAKYFQAIGGDAAEKAASNVKTIIYRGTREDWSGKSAPLEIYQKLPDKLLIHIADPQGEVTQAYNGTSGWRKTAKGTQEIKESALTRFRQNADALQIIPVKKHYVDMNVRRKETIGNRETYVLQVSNEDKTREQYFFDTQTGLLLRRVRFFETPIGRIPQQTDYADYKTVNGVKVPHTVNSYYVDPWVGSIRRFTEIKWNVPIEESKFSK
jgi:photosynthetic reaction center cytochrome c subunit